MALSKEKFHLRTEHSKLLGYWTVELGGLNQVSRGRVREVLKKNSHGKIPSRGYPPTHPLLADDSWPNHYQLW